MLEEFVTIRKEMIYIDLLFVTAKAISYDRDKKIIHPRLF